MINHQINSKSRILTKYMFALYTRHSKEQKEIFDVLNFKYRPFIGKTKVVTQL